MGDLAVICEEALSVWPLDMSLDMCYCVDDGTICFKISEGD
jgi:hypothetical protein